LGVLGTPVAPIFAVQIDGAAQMTNGLVNQTKSRKTCATLKVVVMVVQSNREQVLK
jgi:hypothetical protein